MDLQYVNLFIPTKLLKCNSGVIFGYYSPSLQSHLNINVTAIANGNDSVYCDNLFNEEISLLGLLQCDQNNHFNYKSNENFWCKLSKENDIINVDYLIVDKTVINSKIITLIFYDTRDFMSSQLFGTDNIQEQRLEFVEFLIETLKRTSNAFKNYLSKENISLPFEIDTVSKSTQVDTVSKSTQIDTVSKSTYDDIKKYELNLMIPKRLTASFIEFHYEENKPKRVKKHVRNKSWFPNQRQITSAFVNTVMMTTTGRQVRFRLNQFNQCWEIIKGLRHKRISMSAGNTLLSVGIDMLIGILITWFLVFYSSPSHWLDVAMRQTDYLVNEVESLLNSLMSMPAGLKLNRPLNIALGQFFLYHIYLWKTYMIIVKPLFLITVEILVFCGVIGLTCILSVLSDLVSLATVHIYCFYGYAARLYGLQVIALTALWRLFRGKKWNQLRFRVDSYSYAIDQLFIGTLSFTIVLFLLPTILMYYLVFLVLRLITLSVQGVIHFFIYHISSLPFYMIFLWFIDSKKVAGQVSFEVIDIKYETVKLRLNTNKISFKKLLQMKTDQSIKMHSNVKLSWYEFIQSIIWGRIIYPL